MLNIICYTIAAHPEYCKRHFRDNDSILQREEIDSVDDNFRIRNYSFVLQLHVILMLQISIKTIMLSKTRMYFFCFQGAIYKITIIEVALSEKIN